MQSETPRFILMGNSLVLLKIMSGLQQNQTQQETTSERMGIPQAVGHGTIAGGNQAMVIEWLTASVILPKPER